MRTEPVIAYIGLGSNLSEPVAQIKRARAAIAALPKVSAQAFSRLYRNPPLGPADQPDYVNAVMAVATTQAPLDLLHALQSIETQQGRVRIGERWGPRTLDLDLLLYGDQRINSAELTVPHVGIAQRAFVMFPLLDIAPDLIIPGLGTVTALAAALSASDLVALHD